MLKKIRKKIFKSSWFQGIVSLLIYSYTSLVYFTTKWKVIGREAIDEIIKSDKPVIVVVWHGRILLSPKFPLKPKKHYAIISTHGDGEYIARYMKYHGVKSVRGSSNKGAISAFKNALKVLKDGNLLVITPDGPRGPLMKINGNVLELARMSGAAIIPYAQSTSFGTFLKSWDRFFIPFPFGRGVCIYGDPIYIDYNNKVAIHEANADLENKLVLLTKECDNLVGQSL